MKFYDIEVRAANTQTAVLDHQCDYVESHESLKYAKDRVKYLLSPDRVRFSGDDHVTPMRYAQIWVSEVEGLEMYCHSDFFAKGYNGELEEGA